jgi:hypothetical protein
MKFGERRVLGGVVVSRTNESEHFAHYDFIGSSSALIALGVARVGMFPAAHKNRRLMPTKDRPLYHSPRYWVCHRRGADEYCIRRGEWFYSFAHCQIDLAHHRCFAVASHLWTAPAPK